MKMRDVKKIINSEIDASDIENVLDQFGLSIAAFREGPTVESFRDSWEGMCSARDAVIEAYQDLLSAFEDYKAHEAEYDALCAKQDELEAADAEERAQETAPAIIIVLGGR